MPDILFFLLLGHFVGDYALQTDYMAQTKGKSKLVLTSHVLVYTITVGVFWCFGRALHEITPLCTLTMLGVLVVVYVIHWLQDFLKSKWLNGSKQSYYADQAIHVATLYVIRIFF